MLRDRKEPFSNRGKLAPQAFLYLSDIAVAIIRCVILELRISKPLAINAVFKTQEFEMENTSAFSLRM